MIDPNPLAHAYAWAECHTGISPKCPSSYYDAWSGVLSDIGELTLVGVIIAPALLAYHHHKCSTCRRIGVHKTEDTAQRFCHHHWTREHIDAAKAKHKLRFPHHLAHEDRHIPAAEAAAQVRGKQEFKAAIQQMATVAPVKKAAPKKAPAKKAAPRSKEKP